MTHTRGSPKRITQESEKSRETGPFLPLKSGELRSQGDRVSMAQCNQSFFVLWLCMCTDESCLFYRPFLAFLTPTRFFCCFVPAPVSVLQNSQSPQKGGMQQRLGSHSDHRSAVADARFPFTFFCSFRSGVLFCFAHSPSTLCVCVITSHLRAPLQLHVATEAKQTT